MKFIASSAILLFLLSLTLSAQRQYQSHVVDGATGEALPFVQVYVSEDCGALTNYNGDFQIGLMPADSMTLTCIGYERLRVKASDLTPVTRLKPVSTVMQEVSVFPAENMLMEMAKKMRTEYGRHRKKQQHYLLRMVNEYGDRKELAEAFVRASSAVSLRQVRLLDGQQFRRTDSVEQSSLIGYMNMTRLMELAPMTLDNTFWTPTVKPLNEKASSDYYRRHYLLSCRKQESREGEPDVLQIGLRRKSERSGMLLEGTLYVDAGKLLPLKFEGKLHGFHIELNRSMRQVDVNVVPSIQILYSHEQGYTEIHDIACTMTVGDMKTSFCIFRMDGSTLSGIKGIDVRENLTQAIRQAGYHEERWQQSSYVPRSALEEELAHDFERPELSAELEEKVDGLDRLVARLKAFGEKIPQEKVYVHLDNTSYFQGDTIWFAAYTRQTNTDRPSDVSRVLYAELYNNDGYLVERKMIDMKDGRGHGFFALNNPIQYSGYYELRAYTRWQLNWGLYEHKHSKYASRWFVSKATEKEFYRDYDKLYSRVFPVYDKPQSQEHPERNMTARIMRRYYAKDQEVRKQELTFYPEGGHLVAGVPNSIAFEAAWDDGEWLEGTLHFGQDSVRTVHRGRGRFTFTPVSGKNPDIYFMTAEGKKVKAELPKAEEEGVAMQLSENAGIWQVSLHVSGGLQPDSLGLTVMHEGRLEAFHHIAGSGETIVLGSQDWPAGIHQATVFDSRGRVYADRLFFVHGHGKETVPAAGSDAPLQVTASKKECQPYERVDLTVRGTARKAPISLSVKDGYQADRLFDNGNIMTEMLLSSEIKGFVPDPAWYFESEDEEHRTALDLLMMTQGWRRFEWQDMAVRGRWDIIQPAEQSTIVKGEVHKTYEGMTTGWTDFWDHDNLTRGIGFSNDYTSSGATIGLDINELYKNNKRDKAEIEMALDPYSASFDVNQFNDVLHRSRKYKDQDDRIRIRQTMSIGKNSGQKSGVRIHAELIHLDSGQMVDGETDTRSGRFTLELPNFYGKSVFFLSASDSTKWKKNKRYSWIQMQPNDFEKPAGYGWKFRVPDADYHVRLSTPYPRFVKPYAYHQHTLMLSADSMEADVTDVGDKDSKTLRQVPVKARRRSGLKRFDASQPAILMDAYDAVNMYEDSGILFDHLVRVFVGDYGQDLPYITPQGASGNADQAKNPSNIYEIVGYNNAMRMLHHQDTIPRDSIYSSKYLKTTDRFDPGVFIGWGTCIQDIDKVALYTDYCPRLEGSKRYSSSDLPETRLAIFFYDYEAPRVVYRDRRYILEGFAEPAEFYHPDYSRHKLPEGQKDYRRTLYWNPNLQLDENGEARVTFYNNSRTTTLSVEAEGQAADGTLLWSR